MYLELPKFVFFINVTCTDVLFVVPQQCIESVMGPGPPSPPGTLPPAALPPGHKLRVDLACNNCGTRTTTIWRRDANGNTSHVTPRHSQPNKLSFCIALENHL